LAGKDGYLLAFLYNGLATIAGRKLDLMRLSEIYSRSNRKTFLIVGATLIVGIAIVDTITPSLPLGYLYLYSYPFSWLVFSRARKLLFLSCSAQA